MVPADGPPESADLGCLHWLASHLRPGCLHPAYLRASTGVRLLRCEPPGNLHCGEQEVALGDDPAAELSKASHPHMSTVAKPLQAILLTWSHLG